MTDVSHTTNVDEPTDVSHTTKVESQCVISTKDVDEMFNALDAEQIRYYGNSENGMLLFARWSKDKDDSKPERVAEYVIEQE